MTVQIIQGDALHLPLANETVDLVVTSPPYFALRSYTDGGEHFAGQIGSEATPQEWLENLWAATREMVRCLKPGGSIFVNLGDKYSGYSGANWGHGRNLAGPRGDSRVPIAGPASAPDVYGIPNKSLMLLPERYRIGAVDRLGLIARAVIIWDKPNGLPESVTDRVRRSHEDWIHLVKQPRYYSAVDHIREPQKEIRTGGNGGVNRDFHTEQLSRKWNPSGNAYNPLGKLPGSVWQIPTQPLTVPPELGVDHFAAYPLEWPRRIIQGWTPPGICQECGQGRKPVSAAAYVEQDRLPDRRGEGTGNWILSSRQFGRASRETTITGYTCACIERTPQCESTTDGSEPAFAEPIAATNGQPATGKATQPAANAGYGAGSRSSGAPPTRPAVVLDPFAGTGTTLLAATVLGRDAIGIDLSSDYCRLAAWRVNDPNELARAAHVDKPPPVINGQLTLDGVT